MTAAATLPVRHAPSPIGAGMYPWLLDYKARGLDLQEHWDDVLTKLRAAGVEAWEPMLPVPQPPGELIDLLTRRGMTMPSAYLNARLHEPDWERRVEDVVKHAAALRPAGLRYLVLNPEPIAWGSPQDKGDDELRRQAGALRLLHVALAAHGVVLCYHTHDPEMRQGAREFHHMMLATADLPASDPAGPPGMRWCLDAHWVYRGTGNSNVALLDTVTLYGRRAATLHLRQSHDGVWSDRLEPGDVDYPRVLAALRAAGFNGPAVLEIAREAGSPHREPLDAAHEQSVACWRRWEAEAGGA